MIKTIHVTPAVISLNVLLKDRLRLLSERGFDIVGFTSPSNNSGEFQDCGFRLIESQYLTRSFDILADFRFFLESYRIFKKEQPMIVNTYGPKPGIFARIAARLAGVPIIVHTSWGLFFSEQSRWWLRSFVIMADKFAARFCDYIFSVNQDDLQLMRRYKFKSIQQLGYLGNATDIRNQFNPLKLKEKIDHNRIDQNNSGNHKIIIACVGRLTKAKGFLEFFEAAQTLKKQHPQVIFSVIGIPDNSKNGGVPLALINKLVDEAIIDLHYSIPHVQMPYFYNSIDIMVLPSHREGFPRSLVEAAAMGKPIVTTDTRGCREAVTDGENGILVPVGNALALQQAMETLILDEPLRTKMGKESRKKAEREFDETALVERIISIYQRLLEGKSTSKSPQQACPE